MKTQKYLLLYFLFALLIIPGCAPTEPSERTIVEALAADERFTIFLSLLKAADMTSLLNGDDRYTLFAPTNTAFNDLPPGAVDTLLADKETAADFVERHISPWLLNRIYLRQASTVCDVHESVEMLRGTNWRYGLNEDNQLVIGEAQIIDREIIAENGIIHPITTPLMPVGSPYRPPTIRQLLSNLGPRADRIINAISDVGGPYDEFCGTHLLHEKLYKQGPFTFFMPTDAALASAETQYGIKLEDIVSLTDIIYYSLVTESLTIEELSQERSVQTLLRQPMSIVAIGPNLLKINGVEVRVLEELPAKNGVIYLIDRVIPPLGSDLAHWPPTIARIIETEPDFLTLKQIWEEELTGTEYWGPTTVFVVPDTALKQFQVTTPSAPLSPDTLYFQVDGLVDLSEETQLTTWSNIDLEVIDNGSEITIGNTELGRATITHTIQAANGIIYVLNRPLFPSQ